MIDTNLILCFFLLLNLLLILNFSKIKFFHLNIDKPDKVRKFHSKPTPLAGGQIIFLNILFYCIILNFSEELFYKEIFFKDLESLNYFIFISFSVFFLGFLDDRFNIKANLKFLILFLIILFLLLIDNSLIIYDIKLSFINRNFISNEISFLFTIFCILVYMNAFNMFDGINLQSSLYSLLIFSVINIIFINSFLINILIISLIFFSYLNFKNKAFLGDSGSLLIAFIIGYIFIKLYNLNYIKFADEIVLYMLVPGLDLIRLFITRILKKKNPLKSDREHLHHLLMIRYSLIKTLLIIISLTGLPILLHYFEINNVFSILITVSSYTVLLTYLYQKV